PASSHQLFPLSLHDALPISSERHLAEANAAKLEIAIHCLGAATDVAAADVSGRELGGGIHLRPLTCTCHNFLVFSASSGLSSGRSEEHTSELQSRENLVCRL